MAGTTAGVSGVAHHPTLSVELDNITLAYGKVVVLRECSQSITSRLTAFTGPSGSGKTSLLRAIGGTLIPLQGRVLLDGKVVQPGTRKSPPDPRVAVVHQDHALVKFLTVRDNLLLSAEARGIRTSPDHLAQVLDAVGLKGAILDRWPETLSGGEAQRVAIARALMTEARLILADEPTGELDQTNTRAIVKLLLGVATEGHQVLIATHDPMVWNACDDILSLADGTVSRTRRTERKDKCEFDSPRT